MKRTQSGIEPLVRTFAIGGQSLLSAPLLGGRVLEFRPEGRGLSAVGVQLDGKDRRQAGGLTLDPAEVPILAATVRALEAYVREAA